jgi:prevent-host-death family protein
VTDISIRELRKHGGEAVDRVARGKHLTVTRDGKPVASLQPFTRAPLSLTTLVRRWSTLPAMDPSTLRRDIETAIDGDV